MDAIGPEIGWLTARPIAHRGLHDGNREACENSLTAFRRAIDARYAIECDVHLSRDGVPVVFHDGSLARMTGEDGLVHERDAADLARLRLGATSDSIPTLRELLDLVDGRVPVVVEMKGTAPDRDEGFVRAVVAAIGAYRGPLALMSFDDWLIAQAETDAPALPLGLTAEGTRAEILARHRAVFARRCAFVSYNIHHLPNPFVDWVREDRKRPVISWTVRGPDEAERSRRFADQMTFEGFAPR